MVKFRYLDEEINGKCWLEKGHEPLKPDILYAQPLHLSRLPIT